jgi:HEPN domain-containing protein
VPRSDRTRGASRADARRFLGKAEEFLAAAQLAAQSGFRTATTGLAVHAGMSAADAVTAARLGRRSASPDHRAVLGLLAHAGADGKSISRSLGRLLPLKNRAEYEPREPTKREADQALRAAEQAVATAYRVIESLS